MLEGLMASYVFLSWFVVMAFLFWLYAVPLIKEMWLEFVSESVYRRKVRKLSKKYKGVHFE